MAVRSGQRSRQRSFRLAEETLRDLAALAREQGESANGLARRLIEEGLRIERHPLIYFRAGAAGRRPSILGTRLDVADVVQYLRANDNDASEVAGLLEIPQHWVQAAAAYHADHPAEIDAWIEEQAEYSRRAEDAWRRGQEALA